MGWVRVSRIPGSLRKGKLSLPFPQTSGVSDKGRWEKERSEKSELKGHFEESVFRVKILKGQVFIFTNELCVHRDKDGSQMFSPHIHLGYLPKKHRKDQKAASYQWRKFPVKTDFKAPALNPANTEIAQKRIELRNGPMVKCQGGCIKWATWEHGWAHHVSKKLFKHPWSCLNWISRASEQK